jgi:membrane protease YdiL (CAAX protease family)
MDIGSAPLSAYLVLAVLAASLVWFVRADCADYVAFKQLSRTEDRQARYRAWLIRSLLLFTLASLAILTLLGRLDSLWRVPAEFARALSDSPVAKGGELGDSRILVLMGIAMASGALVAPFLPRLLGSEKAGVGDIDSLLPRNNAERRLAIGLSLAAGVGEEIYFRLMLPLLLVLAGVPAIPALAAAAVIFGLVHLYQGWKGVVATAALGALMSFIYVRSGALWLVVLVHVLIDLNGLILQPFLARRFGNAQGADQAQG